MLVLMTRQHFQRGAVLLLCASLCAGQLSTVSYPSGNPLVTTEAGASTAIGVVLTTQPTAVVTIAVTSSAPGEGVVDKSSLQYTTTNWNVPQTVTVTGVQDAKDDGNTAYSIRFGLGVSTDVRFNSVQVVSDQPVSNTDDDTSGILVSPTSVTTTEAGGTATYTVRLVTVPTDTVVIQVQSQDTTESTVSPSTLTFLPGSNGLGQNSWSLPQTVTVTGVNDLQADGDIVHTISNGVLSSNDAKYAALTAVTVQCTNQDDDSAGVTVTPTSGLTTTEAGGTTQFSVVLRTMPTVDVTINMLSDNVLEGTLSSASLTFTTTDWNVAKLVTVTGVQDTVQDGTIDYTVRTTTTSGDTDYQGNFPATINLKNTDDDTAGIVVTPTSALLQTTEDQGAARKTDEFTVVLSSKPTSTVVVTSVVSSTTNEGSASPPSISFTTTDWNVPRTVTVSGLDDNKADGDIPYTVVNSIDATSTADTNYKLLNPADVACLNLDDDVAGVTLTAENTMIPVSTSETGSTFAMRVKLSTEPTADVTLSISSTDLTEGTVLPATVTLTATTWNIGEVVTATGVADNTDDGNVVYSVIADVSTSTDTTYTAISPVILALTNVDIDTAEILVDPVAGLITSELGTSVTFTVQLKTSPTANVDIAIASSDTSEVVIDKSLLTFTSGTYATKQTITVTGVQDAVDDGPVAFTIDFSPAVSTDTAYSGMNDVKAVAGINNDDTDTAGVEISPTSIVVTEAGGTATFLVSLFTQPLNDVTIDLSSSAPTEGVVSPSTLVFTSASNVAGKNAWSSPATVTVTGVDDQVDDGDVAFTIVTSTATSVDPKYSGIIVQDVSVSNTNDDTAAVSITSAAVLFLSEVGSTATYSMRLASKPTDTVTITLSTNNSAEVTFSPTSLSFDATTWETAQIVTLTGKSDSIDDGDVGYSISHAATSNDAKYRGITISDVVGTNQDIDTAAVVIEPVGTPPLQTTEAAVTQGFDVSLSTQPTADVTLFLTCSDTTEGSVPATGFVFRPSTFSSKIRVTVTGVPDDMVDGDVAYTVAVSSIVSTDVKYSSLLLALINSVSFLNLDTNVALILVDAANPLVVNEDDGTGMPLATTFSVRLQTSPNPGKQVYLTVDSEDHTEAVVSTSTLTFTETDWSVLQVVTVTGVDDLIDDGTQSFNIFVSPIAAPLTVPADMEDSYKTLASVRVPVQSGDNDVRSVIITPTTVTTSEAGTSDQFTVVLGSQPEADVTITLVSQMSGEGSLSATSLIFQAGTWSSVQTVTVTGLQDPIQDGDQTYSIVTTVISTDTMYSAVVAPDVTVTNTDDDVAAIVLSNHLSKLVSETGTSDTFMVRLATQPTADVVITFDVDKPTEVALSTKTLTFTSGGTGQWSTQQTVTLTGLDDLIADDNQNFIISFSTATSTDTSYSGLAVSPSTITGINQDNDTPGILLAPPNGVWMTEVTESGTEAKFVASLKTQPVGDVVITFAVSDATEAEIVAPATVTLTNTNWNVPQTVSVKGVNDDVDDGDQPFTVQGTVTTAASDFIYSTLVSDLVSIVCRDDDVRGIVMSSYAVSTKEGTVVQSSITMALTSQPTADVTVNLQSTDTTEGNISPLQVILPSDMTWATPLVVTINVVDDAIADGTQVYQIRADPAVSNDANYNGFQVQDVVVSNEDDDVPGITMTAPVPNNEISETGTAVTFTVVLDSEPTAMVTVHLASSDHTEGALTPEVLTFSTTDYASPQTVTLTGQDDNVADGVQPVFVSVSHIVTTDVQYADTMLFLPRLTGITNADDDVAGLSFLQPDGVTALNAVDFTTATTLITNENGGAVSFVIKLRSEPLAPVTVSITSRDTSEGVVSVPDLVLTPANWDGTNTVTVTGMQDAVQDGTVTYEIFFVTRSTDTQFNALTIPSVFVSNEDDDLAGVGATPTSIETVENGAPVTFNIVLFTQPTKDVVITLTSDNTAEGTVSPSQVVFLADTCTTLPCAPGRNQWSTPQTVTVTPQDDNVADGSITYTIVTTASSDDAVYAALNPPDVRVVNVDDDTPNIIVTPVMNSVPPFVLTEASTLSAQFRVTLTSIPKGDVTVGITVADATEVAVDLATLTFTTTDYATPQTVTVTAVDDSILDGDVASTVNFDATSMGDPGYDNLIGPRLSMLTQDNDVAGFLLKDSLSNVITDINRFRLSTTEAGTTDQFFISLTSEPSSDVVLTVLTSDTTEGVVSPASIRFDSTNYQDIPVTVSGQNDDVQDGDVSFTITFPLVESLDTNYNGRVLPTILGLNQDDDTAGVNVDLRGVVPPLVVDEAGAEGKVFFINLLSQPTDVVTVPVTSGDHTEGKVEPQLVFFGPANYSAPVEIRVTGVDDMMDDGNVAYNVMVEPAQSRDTVYQGLTSPANVIPVSTTDDDVSTGAVCVLPGCSCCEGITHESAFSPDHTLRFTVALLTQPLADVTVPISSNDTSEVVVSTSFLLFTPGSWSFPQTVTVTSVQDSVDDGDVPVSIVLHPAISDDTRIAGLDINDIQLVNGDDDTFGVEIAPLVLVVNEAGTSTNQNNVGNFSVVLLTQPTHDVTLDLASALVEQATIDTQRLIFTPDIQPTSGKIHWSTPQFVSVRAVNDDVDDGDVEVSIVTSAAQSADLKYHGFNPLDVKVTVVDDDVTGVNVQPTGSLFTSQQGGTATFTVALTSRPSGDVLMDIVSNDTTQGSAVPALLTFTSDTWRTPQTVVVTGVSGSGADTPYSVALQNIRSSDDKYAAVTADTLPTVSLLNTGTPIPGSVTPLPPGTPVVPSTQCNQFAGQCQLKSNAAIVQCVATVCAISECCVSCSSFTCVTGSLSASAICAASGCDASACCSGGGSGSTATLSPSTTSDDDDLPGWAIALIVVASVFCLILIIGLLVAIFCFAGPNSNSNSNSNTSAATAAPKQAPETHTPHTHHTTPHQERVVYEKPPPYSQDYYEPNAAQEPVKEEMVHLQDGDGERYVARWSNSRNQYYYYPEGAGVGARGIWTLPETALVVAWKGGPDGAASYQNSMYAESHAPQSNPFVKDPYSVTPLPAPSQQANPLDNLQPDGSYGDGRVL